SITRLISTVVLAGPPSAAFAQGFPSHNARPPYATGGADPTGVTKLEHFDPDSVDKTLGPCHDFYEYSCHKRLGAHPVPADQVSWSTGSGLQLGNEGVLRDTLEAASKNDPNRTAIQQKIGDYWAACMGEGAIEAAGLKPLEPELARISALKSR